MWHLNLRVFTFNDTFVLHHKFIHEWLGNRTLLLSRPTFRWVGTHPDDVDGSSCWCLCRRRTESLFLPRIFSLYSYCRDLGGEGMSSHVCGVGEGNSWFEGLNTTTVWTLSFRPLWRFWCLPGLLSSHVHPVSPFVDDCRPGPAPRPLCTKTHPGTLLSFDD